MNARDAGRLWDAVTDRTGSLTLRPLSRTATHAALRGAAGRPTRLHP